MPEPCLCGRSSSVKPHLSVLLPQRLGLVVWIAAILVLTTLTTPTTARGQSGCSADDLERRDGPTQRRLAVRIGGEWEFFSWNPEGPAHSLPIDRQSVLSLCLAWETPRHPGLSPQYLYVSTRYRPDQPLSLYRRGFFSMISADDWGDGRTSGRADDLASDFRSYHRERSSIQGTTLFDDLNEWHDSNTSYGLVSGALGSTARLPNGAERLLTVVGFRFYKSWIEFSSRVPSAGGALRVAVAYSGDVGELESSDALEYLFEIE